jgi:cytochrome P450
METIDGQHHPWTRLISRECKQLSRQGHVAYSSDSWGYGNHVCPGRFFAVRLMKLVIMKLLLDYDLKWDRSQHDSPSRLPIEGQFLPNMEQKIQLRKRKASV